MKPATTRSAIAITFSQNFPVRPWVDEIDDSGSVPKMANIRLMVGHLGAIASESVVMFFAGGARTQTGRHCSTTPE